MTQFNLPNSRYFSTDLTIVEDQTYKPFYIPGTVEEEFQKEQERLSQSSDAARGLATAFGTSFYENNLGRAIHDFFARKIGEGSLEPEFFQPGLGTLWAGNNEDFITNTLGLDYQRALQRISADDSVASAFVKLDTMFFEQAYERAAEDIDSPTATTVATLAGGVISAVVSPETWVIPGGGFLKFGSRVPKLAEAARVVQSTRGLRLVGSPGVRTYDAIISGALSGFVTEGTLALTGEASNPDPLAGLLYGGAFGGAFGIANRLLVGRTDHLNTLRDMADQEMGLGTIRDAETTSAAKATEINSALQAGARIRFVDTKVDNIRFSSMPDTNFPTRMNRPMRWSGYTSLMGNTNFPVDAIVRDTPFVPKEFKPLQAFDGMSDIHRAKVEMAEFMDGLETRLDNSNLRGQIRTQLKEQYGLSNKKVKDVMRYLDRYTLAKGYTSTLDIRQGSVTGTELEGQGFASGIQNREGFDPASLEGIEQAIAEARAADPTVDLEVDEAILNRRRAAMGTLDARNRQSPATSRSPRESILSLKPGTTVYDRASGNTYVVEGSNGVARRLVLYVDGAAVQTIDIRVRKSKDGDLVEVLSDDFVNSTDLEIQGQNPEEARRAAVSRLETEADPDTLRRLEALTERPRAFGEALNIPMPREVMLAELTRKFDANEPLTLDEFTALGFDRADHQQYTADLLLDRITNEDLINSPMAFVEDGNPIQIEGLARLDGEIQSVYLSLEDELQARAEIEAAAFRGGLSEKQWEALRNRELDEEALAALDEESRVMYSRILEDTEEMVSYMENPEVAARIAPHADEGTAAKWVLDNEDNIGDEAVWSELYDSDLVSETEVNLLQAVENPQERLFLFNFISSMHESVREAVSQSVSVKMLGRDVFASRDSGGIAIPRGVNETYIDTAADHIVTAIRNRRESAMSGTDILLPEGADLDSVIHELGHSILPVILSPRQQRGMVNAFRRAIAQGDELASRVLNAYSDSIRAKGGVKPGRLGRSLNDLTEGGVLEMAEEFIVNQLTRMIREGTLHEQSYGVLAVTRDFFRWIFLRDPSAKVRSIARQFSKGLRDTSWRQQMALKEMASNRFSFKHTVRIYNDIIESYSASKTSGDADGILRAATRMENLLKVLDRDLKHVKEAMLANGIDLGKNALDRGVELRNAGGKVDHRVLARHLSDVVMPSKVKTYALLDAYDIRKGLQNRYADRTGVSTLEGIRNRKFILEKIDDSTVEPSKEHLKKGVFGRLQYSLNIIQRTTQKTGKILDSAPSENLRRLGLSLFDDTVIWDTDVLGPRPLSAESEKAVGYLRYKEVDRQVERIFSEEYLKTSSLGAKAMKLATGKPRVPEEEYIKFFRQLMDAMAKGELPADASPALTKSYDIYYDFFINEVLPRMESSRVMRKIDRADPKSPYINHTTGRVKYYPQVWNQSAIRSKKDEFIRMMADDIIAKGEITDPAKALEEAQEIYAELTTRAADRSKLTQRDYVLKSNDRVGRRVVHVYDQAKFRDAGFFESDPTRIRQHYHTTYLATSARNRAIMRAFGTDLNEFVRLQSENRVAMLNEQGFDQLEAAYADLSKRKAEGLKTKDMTEEEKIIWGAYNTMVAQPFNAREFVNKLIDEEAQSILSKFEGEPSIKSDVVEREIESYKITLNNALDNFDGMIMDGASAGEIVLGNTVAQASQAGMLGKLPFSMFSEYMNHHLVRLTGEANFGRLVAQFRDIMRNWPREELERFIQIADRATGADVRTALDQIENIAQGAADEFAEKRPILGKFAKSTQKVAQGLSDATYRLSGAQFIEKNQRAIFTVYAENELAINLPRMVKVFEAMADGTPLSKDLLRKSGFPDKSVDAFAALQARGFDLEKSRILSEYIQDIPDSKSKVFLISQLRRDEMAAREAGDRVRADLLMDTRIAFESFVTNTVDTAIVVPNDLSLTSLREWNPKPIAGMASVLQGWSNANFAKIVRAHPQRQTANLYKWVFSQTSIAFASYIALVMARGEERVDEMMEEIQTRDGLLKHLANAMARASYSGSTVYGILQDMIMGYDTGFDMPGLSYLVGVSDRARKIMTDVVTGEIDVTNETQARRISSFLNALPITGLWYMSAGINRVFDAISEPEAERQKTEEAFNLSNLR